MEVTGLICDMSLCRLCAEENRNGSELFPVSENDPDLSELANKYLPLKIEKDRKFPTKICPGCNIQLEATKSFMDLIVEGQAKLRQLLKAQQDRLYRQEKRRLQLEDVLKSVNPGSTVDEYTIQSDETGEKFIIQIFSPGPLFSADHELALRAEGLTRPKRKRGRPPKPPLGEDTPICKLDEPVELKPEDCKRRRKIKAPTRYSEAIRGKELDKVFKQEGVIDEESVSDENGGPDEDSAFVKVEEVIGHLEGENGEDLGQPVVVNKSARARHRGVGHSRKRRKYQCEICGREFLHNGRYELHKKMHDVEYKCTHEHCNFITDKRGLLDKHQKETGHEELSASEKVDEYGTLELPTQLESPEVKSPNKEAKPEEKNSGSKKDWFCKDCSKSFTCKQNYEVHLKAVHAGERPFSCNFCSKRFSYANSLKVHQIQHYYLKGDNGSGVQYRCPSCPKVFKHPSSLQYHRDSEHTNGRRFVCNKCNKPFKHRQLLQRHQLVHTDERPHRCPQCNAAFKTRNSLLHHTQSVHAGYRGHWCNLCNKAFAHKTALKLHMRWHSGLRPYQCEYCKKTFSQKGNLAEHRRIHTGEKPYQCDHCGKAFTTSSQFRLHKKRHSEERPHKCEYCQKGFLSKVMLKCHLRRHFDEKPFKCGSCGKAFPESWTLKKHERLHTGEKPYKCSECPKTFADSSNLAKHRRTHRKQVPRVAVPEKQMVFVTYEKDCGGDAIVTYIEPQAPLIETNLPEEAPTTIQLQQLVDQEGNPITFLTQDGQQVNVVTSTEDGQENIQGLLPDGTLLPISLTTAPEKPTSRSSSVILDEVSKTCDISMDAQLLPANIHFLSDEDAASKTAPNIQFVTEDSQNSMCLVTTYNIDNSYLNLQ